MKLITSSSPHIRSGETTRRLMGTVLLALLPTLAAGVWFFGCLLYTSDAADE